MERFLSDRVVIVVGAAGGIGAAVARAVAEAGARLVLADHGVSHTGSTEETDRLSDLAAEFRANGIDAVTVTDSVTTIAGGRAMVQAALGTWGRLDGAVCCQAIQSDSLLVDYAEDEWNAIIATHLTGHFVIFQAAARAMIEQGRGSIVGFGSGYVQGTAHRSAYRAAKAGVVGLTKSAALEFADTGVRVNCVAPAADTRMTEAAGVTSGGHPDDVAPLVVYLLSDLSGDVNGEIISIAGSRVAGWRDPYQDRFASRGQRWTVADLATEIPFVLGRQRVGTPIAAQSQIR